MAIFIIYGIIIFVVVDLFRRFYLPSVRYKREKKDGVEIAKERLNGILGDSYLDKKDEK